MTEYDFRKHLLASKGSLIKSRRAYMREHKWRDKEWYEAWHTGLANEIELASIEYGPV